MSLKRNSGIVAALLMLLASSATAGDFDVSMEVVGPGESFDEMIVSRIALPSGKNASGSENMPTTHKNDRLGEPEGVLREGLRRSDQNTGWRQRLSPREEAVDPEKLRAWDDE